MSPNWPFICSQRVPLVLMVPLETAWAFGFTQIDQDISSVRCSKFTLYLFSKGLTSTSDTSKKAYAIVLMNRVKNEKSELEVKNNKTRNGKTYAIVWSHVVRLTIYLYNLWYQDELLEVMTWNLCTNIGFESDLFYSKVN